MKFAFIIMGNFDAGRDSAVIHEGGARITGVASLEEACAEAKKLLAEGIDCIELCGAFGPEGARQVIRATEGKIPVGYVTHLPEQDRLYQTVFGS